MTKKNKSNTLNGGVKSLRKQKKRLALVNVCCPILVVLYGKVMGHDGKHLQFVLPESLKSLILDSVHSKAHHGGKHM